MVTQYPHIMTITIQSEAFQDADGNWQPATTSTREVICRAEPNGRGGTVAAADGSLIVYSWTVYMPVQEQAIPFGGSVEVKKGSDVIATGKAIRFSNGQLNARLWL